MRYEVSGEVTVSAYTIVEADSVDEASEIASEREVAGLSISAFAATSDEAWHILTIEDPQVILIEREDD